MKKLSDKIASAAHIKHHTKGTSNEISFSVLDAARSALDKEKGSVEPRFSLPGVIPLFTLGRGKKPIATPVKERGLHLSSGEFVSVEDSSSAASSLAALAGSQVSSKLASGGSSLSSPSGAPGVSSATASSPASSSAPRLSSRRSDSSDHVAWKTPEDDVARRKRTRVRRKRLVQAVSALSVSALLVAGVYLLVSVMEEQRDVRGKLLAGIEDVEQADAAVVSFDEMVISVINDDGMALDVSELSQGYEKLSLQVEASCAELESAKALIEQLQSDLADNREKDAANQAIAAINARLNMIDSGRLIVEETISARTAMQYASQGWNGLLAADALARDAAALVADTSVDSVTASMEKSREASALFGEAAEAFDAARTSYPSFDMELYATYVDLRLAAQACALASDQAYLDRDKETAASQNDEYNSLDARAADLAQSIAANPSEGIAELLLSAVSEAEASYLSERSIASSADAVLRGYLGTKNK